MMLPPDECAMILGIGTAVPERFCLVFFSVFIHAAHRNTKHRSGGPDESARVLIDKIQGGAKVASLIRRIGLDSLLAFVVENIFMPCGFCSVAGTHIQKRHTVFSKPDGMFFGRAGEGNDEGLEARNEIFKDEAVTFPHRIDASSIRSTCNRCGCPSDHARQRLPTGVAIAAPLPM